jgi:hypothetical protein
MNEHRISMGKNPGEAYFKYGEENAENNIKTDVKEMGCEEWRWK